MGRPLIPESDRLDRYLRSIHHSCTPYCEPPIHYQEVIGTRRGPEIIPPVDKVELLLILLVILTVMVLIIVYGGPHIQRLPNTS